MATDDVFENGISPDIYDRDDYGDIEDIAEYAFHTLASNPQDEVVVDTAKELLSETVDYLDEEYNIDGFNFDARNSHSIDELSESVEDEAVERAHREDDAVIEEIPGCNDRCYFKLKKISSLLEELEEAKK
jgi:hypothetical protein